jgi:hypothetical protein
MLSHTFSKHAFLLNGERNGLARRGAETQRGKINPIIPTHLPMKNLLKLHS